jgi:putative transposase
MGGPGDAGFEYRRLMPRPPRLIFPGECYHVLNRANRRAEVFHDANDYRNFMKLMARAQDRVPLDIFAACIMPNHLHLVVRPHEVLDITRWMQWLCTTHARHYHEKYGSSGHVWQGRFKHCHVQSDQYLLTVLRYVERNALTARLSNRAEDWRWGSLCWRAQSDPVIALTPAPIPIPTWWPEFVNQPLTAVELEAVRTSITRQRPFGDPDWVERQAKAAGLDQTLAEVGRPRKRRSGTIC